ncbi:carotenoid biosynthesis protein [Rhizomonospora bruguierae]|uniref:carotenoid biosynthesis protein n=1 Tax=Rhizomonospora bruguierae TaxID=1581705 RepID=UPI001BCFF280|nr:carotenoid biosynthesis protein [Micromonospora sp. NBRC 107566]
MTGAPWLPLAAMVLAQIGYPLADGPARAGLTVLTVLLGYAASVLHAAVTRGARTAAALVLTTTGGGLAVEALGAHTGFPFGHYAYGDAIGPKLAGVPLIVPLAWTWMAWPAWLAAPRTAARPLIAAVGLTAWDLFLDPQMVAERYWTWDNPHPALPGVPGVPLTNYAGWLVVAIAMMLILRATIRDRPGRDRPMYALYLWTYASSTLAHAAFLGLPASAVWGAAGMGVVAIPLAVRLWRSRS